MTTGAFVTVKSMALVVLPPVVVTEILPVVDAAGTSAAISVGAVAKAVLSVAPLNLTVRGLLKLAP